MAPSSSASKSSKRKVILIESSDEGNEDYSEGTAEETNEGSESEGSLDSDDPDADAPKVKKVKITPRKVEQSKKVVKAVKEVKEKKEKKEVKSPKGKKKDNDGTNLRVVKTAALHPAPKTDPDTKIILPSTLEFLGLLRIEANNEREWFKAREPIYRHLETNFKTFVGALMPLIETVDWTCPALPPKDVLGRIYRDVRFSKSKQPYKTAMTANTSRSGKKGKYAGYHIQISQGRSMIAFGSWEVEGPVLTTIREAIIRDSAPLRKMITSKKFLKLFGATTVFGRSDELKTKPKMTPPVTKDHPDIDLLKLKSIAVAHSFTDEEVLSPNFLETIHSVLEIGAPFVCLLNEMIQPTPLSDEEEGAQSEVEEEE